MLENLYNSLKYAGNYTQFMSFLEVVGLLEELRSLDQYTIFAPNDDAFNKIPKQYINDLFNDVERIKQIASYHMISGIVNMNEIENMPSIDNRGTSINITKNADGIFIENAKIISPDHEALNGIYYEVDSLIIPKEKL